LELWNRTGGYKNAVSNLNGLTASVQELNMLNGVRLDETVQTQLNNKVDIGSLGSMAFQEANNVDITGGTAKNISLSDSAISDVTMTSSNISDTQITHPTGSTIVATAGGTINTNTNTAGNIGASETNLLIYDLLANTLNTDKNYIEIVGFGTFAANANNKQLKLKFGGTTLYDSGSLALNGGAWKISATIIRVSATSQKCIAEVSSGNALLPNKSFYTSASEDLDSTLTITFTGKGIVDNDVVQEGMIIKYYKG
jgi:hypothetical protein